jgi:hypothetical protein
MNCLCSTCRLTLIRAVCRQPFPYQIMEELPVTRTESGTPPLPFFSRECYGLWLLKNSIFLKTAKIWGYKMSRKTRTSFVGHPSAKFF